MAHREATATMTSTMPKNVVESVRVNVYPPPRSDSASESQEKGIGGSSGVKACRLKRIFSQNNANFERSGLPSRFMYFCNNSWMNFSDDVLETLRTCFLERKPIFQVSIHGAQYVFDFKRMLQIDFLTGNCRSISWIDENRKCFFPNDFFSEEGFMEAEYENEKDDYYKTKYNNCNPRIEIEVKVDRTSSKRKREEEPEASSPYKAVRLDVVRHLEEQRAPKWLNTKLLEETERVYLLIKNNFLKGIGEVDGGVSVTSVHQCKRERPLDKARLEVFQKQIENTRAARGTSNMIYAWYGASAKGVESILAYGFGSPSRVPATDVYGSGVYLSPLGLPHLSAKLADSDDDGVKHLILCQVILGNVEKVEAGSQQCCPSSVDFDTGSDDPMNPKWYVVWSTNANMHILPECVVSFKPSCDMQGKPRPVVDAKYSLEKLFSIIKSSLPPAKVREILISYRTFKAGMLAKDAFVRNLRLIAGDEVLRSAFQEINAPGRFGSVGIV